MEKDLKRFSDIESALTWMESLYNEAPRAGFGRILAAMAYFDNPHTKFPIIHITGTNGKGSVTAYTRDLLMSQGLRVGCFTSPHILKFNERIAINHQAISDEDLLELINEMLELNDYLATTEWGPISGFEFYTVLMARYFARETIDVALIEVGIGGLRDCTNIMDGKIAVITTVGLDHVELLGDTFTAVAQQKAGIIKEGATVVTGLLVPEALRVIEATSQQQKAKLFNYGTDYVVSQVEDLGEAGTQFHYQLKATDEHQEIRIRMLGEHQIKNAATALTVFCQWMKLIASAINWQKARLAIASTNWFARMEKLYHQPVIYVDGAHNAEGLGALKQTVQRLFADKRVTILYAGLTTKNQIGQVPLLVDMAVDQVVISQFDYYTAMTIAQFREIILTHYPEMLHQIQLEADWQEYIKTFIDQYQQDDKHVMVVTGSLYFASQVKAWMNELNA